MRGGVRQEWTLPMPRSQVGVSTFLNVSTVLAVSILFAVQAYLISTGAPLGLLLLFPLILTSPFVGQLLP
jgi:hypothetical protein